VELQHRLVRQTIEIAVTKGMEDMESNAGRSIRNLIDLGRMFAKAENQKWFFDMVKKVFSNPRNPYKLLATRILTDIDRDTVKTVGINFGYGSLVCGAGKLRKHQELLNTDLPWMLRFTRSRDAADAYAGAGYVVGESAEMGIGSYVFCAYTPADVRTACDAAERYPDCVFFVEADLDAITPQTTRMLYPLRNVAVCLRTRAVDWGGRRLERVSALLRQARCFYGFRIEYDEENAADIACNRFIRSAIALGHLFGVYVAAPGVSRACADAVYDFVCEERGEQGQPLIALEWRRDMRYISGRIRVHGGCMNLDMTRRTWLQCGKIRSAPSGMVAELIRTWCLAPVPAAEA